MNRWRWPLFACFLQDRACTCTCEHSHFLTTHRVSNNHHSWSPRCCLTCTWRNSPQTSMHTNRSAANAHTLGGGATNVRDPRGQDVEMVEVLRALEISNIQIYRGVGLSWWGCYSRSTASITVITVLARAGCTGFGCCHAHTKPLPLRDD